jgi:ribose 5-phosphate isomerase B
MKIVIAADHGGVDLKDDMIGRLNEAGHEVLDAGTYGPESVDYPDFAFKAANKVVSGDCPRGILICGTGIGMSIAANKVDGIFCAKVNSKDEGKLAAEHNHANMIALGARTTDPEVAWAAIQGWLSTEFGPDRHAKRVGKISSYKK